MGIVVIPLSAFLPIIVGGTKQLIISLGIFLVVLSFLSQLHSWSTCILLSGYDTNRDQQIVKRLSKPSVAVILQMEEDVQFAATNCYGGSSNINPFEAIKTKNLLSRRQTCREQLKHWSEVLRTTEALMLSQAEMDGLFGANFPVGSVGICPPPNSRPRVANGGNVVHPLPSPAPSSPMDIDSGDSP